jgi:membrane-associated protease RseP (regulator of RpoE activity)
MLLKSPKRVERTVSWRWTFTTAGGLLALAVLVSGIGPRADASPGKTDVQKSQAVDKTPPQDKDKQDKDNQDNAPKAPQPPGTPFPRGGGGFPNNDPDDMAGMMQRMMRQRGGMGMGGFFGGHPRLGVTVAPPSEALVDQLDLPKNQGLVISQVVPDTPAAKAGLKANDIILELNGKPVASNQGEFVRAVQEIKADAKVEVVVLRKGKKETIKDLTLPEEKQPRGFGFGGGAGQGGFPFGDGNNPPFPRQGFGGGAGMMGGFGGPNTVITTVTRSNERFTTRHQEGSLIITVTGTVTDGKSKTDKIHVQDGQVTHDYEGLDKVPDQYKDKAKNLVEMSEKGSIRIEIKTPEAKPEPKPEAKPEAK